MLKKNRKNIYGEPSRTIFPKIFLVLTLIILVYVAIALGRQTYRKYRIEKEVSSLEEQISGLEQDSLKLSALLSYFQKEGFKEKEARAKLNFKKPDEKVIILAPSEETSVREEELQKEEEISNPRKWWGYFLKNQK